MSRQFQPPRRGLIPPLATPLSASDRLDETGLTTLTQRAIDAGVDGVFVLGTTSEAPSLSQRLKRDVIRHACAAASGQVPVLAGLLETSLVETLVLGEYAATCGATALVLTLPFYFTLDSGQALEYLERTIAQLPLPVYLYHIPERTRVELSPYSLALGARIPGVAGLKDSSGDLRAFGELRSLIPDVPLFWGPEQQLAQAIALGADGGIAGGANLFPALYVALYRAAREGDLPRVAALQGLVDRVSQEVYASAKAGSGYLLGLKCALGELGIGNGRPEEPFTGLAGPEREVIRKCITEVSALLAEVVVSTS